MSHVLTTGRGMRLCSSASMWTGSVGHLALYSVVMGINRLGGEADHWLPSGAVVEDEWSCTSAIPCTCTKPLPLYRHKASPGDQK